MRRGSIFWALVLIVVGIVLLLDELGFLGFLGISAWSLIWPLVFIALGVRVLWGVLRGSPSFEAKEASIPLDGATQARVHIHHGAGRLEVKGGARPGELASGSFGGGLSFRTWRQGDLLEADMHVPSSSRSLGANVWNWGQNTIDWSVALSDAVPLELILEAGANDTSLDLAELQVSKLKLATGASSTQVTLPAHAGYTQVKVESGAADVRLRVPDGVAARIKVGSVLAGVDVDTHRFPRLGDLYQSPDYETAANKAEIKVEVAIGSVKVR